MNYESLKRLLKTEDAMAVFARLYGLKTEGYSKQMTRYTQLVKCHEELYNNENSLCIISSPGRSEIIGNHTDHNKGCVLAAAINVDTLAVVAKRNDTTVNIYSEGYDPVKIDLQDLKPVPQEAGTSAALVRGVAARMQELKYIIGGFDAVVTSDVLSGSGMSSSAAFEVMCVAVLDKLYNGFSIPAIEKAKISQYAENNYFMKPSGLMDQMASAVGGLVAIDFKNDEPLVDPISYSFADKGYALAVVAPGGSHDDLTDEYAAIPKDMFDVATYFKEDCLRKVRKEQVLQSINELRSATSDRAILRSLHFFNENERVLQAVEALKSDDIDAFIDALNASGISSKTMLQNVFVAGYDSQPLALSQAIAAEVLAGTGASRVHGGGFAGTTLHLVPLDKKEAFKQEMESAFGNVACRFIDVRPDGACVAFG
ncbi:MAG: galactokinase family protein [Eubacteriales bacterium]|nr:galactokinase family protein [Eubacteriales bacterium]